MSIEYRHGYVCGRAARLSRDLRRLSSMLEGLTDDEMRRVETAVDGVEDSIEAMFAVITEIVAGRFTARP